MLAKQCEWCSGCTWLIKQQLESTWVSPASLEKAHRLPPPTGKPPRVFTAAQPFLFVPYDPLFTALPPRSL